MKRKVFALTMVLSFIFGVYAFAAENRCPLTGNTYTFELESSQFELSGFDCTFGPGCEATCDLWYGNFETGPLYHERLPFVCYKDGSVILTVDKIEMPCALNAEGDLECLIVDVSNYECYDLGNKTWCIPESGAILNFEQRE
jgi:hypothetical protein